MAKKRTNKKTDERNKGSSEVIVGESIVESPYVISQRPRTREQFVQKVVRMKKNYKQNTLLNYENVFSKEHTHKHRERERIVI